MGVQEPLPCMGGRLGWGGARVSLSIVMEICRAMQTKTEKYRGVRQPNT